MTSELPHDEVLRGVQTLSLVLGLFFAAFGLVAMLVAAFVGPHLLLGAVIQWTLGGVYLYGAARMKRDPKGACRWVLVPSLLLMVISVVGVTFAKGDVFETVPLVILALYSLLLSIYAYAAGRGTPLVSQPEPAEKRHEEDDSGAASL